jgi:hypothetical protein
LWLAPSNPPFFRVAGFPHSRQSGLRDFPHVVYPEV